MSQFPQFPGSKYLRWYGRMVYGAAKMTAGPVLRRLYNVRLEGVEAIPPNGAAIIAPNHLSLLDPFFITLVVPRFITFIGKAEYFDAWQTRMLMEMAGVIPVRREDPSQSSLEAGKSVLEAGNLLGIFPEGTRSPDGRLYKGKTGAARMAAEVGCPVLPTGLIGTAQVMPKEAKLPGLGPRVTVKFGKPMSVPPEGREDGRVLREFTDDLMGEIAGLSGQEYRHRYAYTKRVGQLPNVSNLFA
ncbi:MAG TPA: lysophospholipid acyltransferase family protein [Actinomycetota bacterium]|jgi:1-acyl-sn-glycerol-3-phosphate acyltransferase|nr:lysophospholipid acyltransferase family protein [Actinomycetota bacterium]